MVSIGFIVEGETEKTLIESKNFQVWATAQNIKICRPVLNAKGGGNLLPKNIEPMVQRLRNVGANHIVILTDLERETSEQAVINKIGKQHTQYIFVAVKAIEAWFLADDLALKKWLRIDTHETQPEKMTGMPWQRIHELENRHNKKQSSSKIVFAKAFIEKHGFSFERAAQHPHCPSAKKFHDGLLAIVQP